MIFSIIISLTFVCLIFKEIEHLQITSRKFVCLGACMHAGCINYAYSTHKNTICESQMK